MFPDSSSLWVFYYFHMYFIQTLLIIDQTPEAFQDTATFLSGEYCHLLINTAPAVLFLLTQKDFYT